jgi:hypothetical protein
VRAEEKDPQRVRANQHATYNCCFSMSNGVGAELAGLSTARTGDEVLSAATTTAAGGADWLDTAIASRKYSSRASSSAANSRSSGTSCSRCRCFEARAMRGCSGAGAGNACAYAISWGAGEARSFNTCRYTDSETMGATLAVTNKKKAGQAGGAHEGYICMDVEAKDEETYL